MMAPSPEKVSKYMRWIILIFLGYAFYHTMFGPKRPQKAPHTPTTVVSDKGKDCDSLNSALATSFAAFAMPLIPSITPALHVTDTKEGTGEGAMCGQTAAVRYEYANQSGAIIFDHMADAKLPDEVRIGGTELLPGVERGLLGMRVGGERTISMPPALAFGGVKDVHTLNNSAQFRGYAPTDAIVAKVALLSLTPPAPVSPMPIRVINGLFGGGDPVQCGDTVHAEVNIWKLDGTQLFTTNGKSPLTFTIGQSALPFGIEEGVIGMRVGGQRRLIVPPAFNKPLDTGSKSLLGDVQPPNEIILVEVMLIKDSAPPVASAAPAPTDAATNSAVNITTPATNSTATNTAPKP